MSVESDLLKRADRLLAPWRRPQPKPREVSIFYTYMMHFKRRKGWRLKASESRVFSCPDAAYDVHSIAVYYYSSKRDQKMVKAQTVSLLMGDKTLIEAAPLTMFPPHNPMPFPVAFRIPAGQEFSVRLDGTPSKKLTKRMVVGVSLMGVKAYPMGTKEVRTPRSTKSPKRKHRTGAEGLRK